MARERAVHRPGLGVRGGIMLAVAVAGIAGWIYAHRVGEPKPDATPAGSILAHIPPGAMLVATVDLEALRHTALGEQLLGQGRTVAGLGDIASLCGADPMDAAQALAIAVPDAAQDTGFGLFASGPFDAARLIGCAEKIVAKRGGRPVKVPEGRFSVLKDASLELSSAELAVADGGPVILGEAAYVRAALGTVPAESLEADEQHARLRAFVPVGQLVATAVLSGEQRRALLAELRAQQMADSPFGSVTGAALSLSVTEELTLALALRCEDAAACAEAANHIRDAARTEADTLAARAIGLSEVLQRMTVDARDGAVHVRVVMPAAEALTALRRALALRKLAGEPSDAPALDPSRVPAPAAPPVGDPAPAGGTLGERIEAKPRASAKVPD